MIKETENGIPNEDPNFWGKEAYYIKGKQVSRVEYIKYLEKNANDTSEKSS